MGYIDHAMSSFSISFPSFNAGKKKYARGEKSGGSKY